MKIGEINNRISELKNDIELLKAIKRDYIERDRDENFIRALDDGIKYVSIRLEEYQTKDWIMIDIKQDF